MATDSNELRNRVFGKVAHSVISERLLPKGQERLPTNSDFRILSAVHPLVTEEMVTNRISDSMVIEVFVNNMQASPGEVRDLLMERWVLTWHRMGRTGIQAWTGVSNNNIEKTLVSMMRRVVLSARMTQTIRLLKRSGNAQFEVHYRILQGASTLYFGATDETRQVTFHGHDGHLWWHINNHTSLSFTLTYRSNAWTPRSAPTHISPMAIIDNYVANAISESPSTRTHAAAQATSSAQPSGIGAQQPQHFERASTSKSPPYPTFATGTTHPGTVHGPSPPSGHQRSFTAGENGVPVHARYSSVSGEDEYAASLPTGPVRSTSQQLHHAYFSPGAGDTGGVISTSTPKNSTFGGPNALYSSPPSGFGMMGGADTGLGHDMGGGAMNSAFGAALHERVPGSSPPSGPGSSSFDRPIRMRSSSSSANPIGSVGSTSISPYRVDLSISNMAKSPPSQHSVVLPLDMMGGPTTSKQPSSGKLTSGTPISFGGAPVSPYVSTTPSTPSAHVPATGLGANTATGTTGIGTPERVFGSPGTPSTGSSSAVASLTSAHGRTLGTTSPWIQTGSTTVAVPPVPGFGALSIDSSGLSLPEAPWSAPTDDDPWYDILRAPNMPQVVLTEARNLPTNTLAFNPAPYLFGLYDEITAFVPPLLDAARTKK